MKGECYGVETGNQAKRNPYCDVNDVVEGAHLSLNYEYLDAKKQLPPGNFKALQEDEREWLKDTLTPTQRGAGASKYDELDALKARTKLVHDWANAPKDVDGGDKESPAEALQREVQQLKDKYTNSQTIDTYYAIKQEQGEWESIMNKAYAKLIEEGVRAENTPGVNWHFAENLRKEQNEWQEFRKSSDATIDDRFGIDESQPGKTEDEVLRETHNVGPITDKKDMVKERAQHLVNLYSELTGPGD